MVYTVPLLSNKPAVFFNPLIYILLTTFFVMMPCADLLHGEVRPQQQWLTRNNGPGYDNDSAVAVAMDKYGNNIVVTGNVYTGSDAQQDYCTVKYTSAGVQKWRCLWDNADPNGMRSDSASDVVVDGKGNVCVTGVSWHGWDLRNDWATVKYDPNGVLLWTRWFSGKGGKRYDTPVAMAVDKNDNIYITGYCDGNDPNYWDYATVKYDPNGNFQWQQWYEGPPLMDDYPADIATDSNFVYVTGSSQRNGGSYDCATIKYRCTDGNRQWVSRYNGSGNSHAVDLAVDRQEFVHITGTTDANGTTDCLTVRYGPGGGMIWRKLYNGPANNIDEGYAVALDNAGHIYVTGDSVNYLRGEPNASYRDILTIRYDANNGAQIWVNAYDANDPNRHDIADIAYAITTGIDGHVYVTGVSDSNYITIKYDWPTGSRRWVATYSYPDAKGYDAACDIATDGSGSVYVTGTSYGGISTKNDYATIKYSQDRDKDGLPDVWETEGIDYNYDGVIDLNLPDADPNHKDLFVEVDAMTGFAPDKATLDRVVDAFAAVPYSLVHNPDYQDGINLHIQIDETNIPDANWPNPWPSFDAVKAARFGDPNQRANPNWQNIRAAKAEAYRYCIFAKTHSGGSSSGLAEINGNDFMVTLGDPNWGAVDANQIAGTFMHEFGHTLGLLHGGDQFAQGQDYRYNFKPNYHSIMNYTWQMPGRVHTSDPPQRVQDYRNSWRLDYSRTTFPSLNEAALNESTGIGGDANHVVPVGDLPPHLVNETGAVDWRRDGDTNDVGVSADINHVRGSVPASPNDTLTGYTDWSNLKYELWGNDNFLDGVQAQTTEEEMTWQVYKDLSDITCAWDFNCDDCVNFYDFAILADQWLDIPGYPPADIAPYGGDGLVDFKDLDLLVDHWLEGTSL
jgi:hypothetical protein